MRPNSLSVIDGAHHGVFGSLHFVHVMFLLRVEQHKYDEGLCEQAKKTCRY